MRTIKTTSPAVVTIGSIRAFWLIPFLPCCGAGSGCGKLCLAGRQLGGKGLHCIGEGDNGGFISGGGVGEGVDCIGGGRCMRLEVVGCSVCVPCGLRLRFPPFLVGEGEGCFKGNPSLVDGGEATPIFALVGEQARVVGKGVCFVDNLNRCQWSFSVIGVGGGIFDLFEKKFDREIWVPRFGHDLVVPFEIAGGDPGIGGVKVGKELKDGDVTVEHVGLLEGT